MQEPKFKIGDTPYKVFGKWRYRFDCDEYSDESYLDEKRDEYVDLSKISPINEIRIIIGDTYSRIEYYTENTASYYEYELFKSKQEAINYLKSLVDEDLHNLKLVEKRLEELQNDSLKI